MTGRERQDRRTQLRHCERSAAIQGFAPRNDEERRDLAGAYSPWSVTPSE
jgi:hypothetical protein